MSEKVRKYLGIAGVILLLSGSYGIVKFVNSYNASIQPSSFRSFAVNGEGKWTSIPDIAKFSYSVVTEGDKNIKALTEKNNTKSSDIIHFLKGSGIDSADIKTTSYSVEPRTAYYSCLPDTNGAVKRCPPSEIVGYTIRQSAEVKIRDFSIVGDVLNGVVVKGANNVSNLQFTTDDSTKIEDLARANAIKKAVMKAEAIAKAGGFKLGRLLSVEESNYYPTPLYPSYGVLKTMESAPMSPPVEPGSEETKVNVTLRYEIR